MSLRSPRGKAMLILIQGHIGHLFSPHCREENTNGLLPASRTLAERTQYIGRARYLYWHRGDSQPFLGFLPGFLAPRVSWIELLNSPKMPWPIRQNWVSYPSAGGGEV